MGTIIALAGLKGGSGKSTVATCLAAEWTDRGRRVLLADADPQGTAQVWGSLAAEAGRPAPTVAAVGEGFHRADQLPRLAAGFDLAILDTPPRMGKLQRAALAVADLAVLPCGPSPADLWALRETVALVEAVRELRPGLLAAILFCRVPTGARMAGEVRDALAGLGLPVLRAELGARVAYAEALGVGLGAAQYRSGPAAVEVRMLADELEGMTS